MEYPQALSFINSFINYEKNLHQISPALFKLERVQRVLKHIGDPQQDLKFVHVAGTKGKGSSCAMIAQILKEGGYRVGLYTSPHLKNVRERIRILDEARNSGETGDNFRDMITEREFADSLGAIKDELGSFRWDDVVGNLTFFEALTALALFYFHKQQCDFVVLETGLGGRLDATNCTDTLVCGITSISLEHQHLLGDTLDQIAYEKAAIIKNSRQRVVLAPQVDVVMDVLIKRCRQYNIQPVVINKDITYELIGMMPQRMQFNMTTPHTRYEDLECPLIGSHQLINAALAVGIIEALESLGFPVAGKAIFEGLRTTRWPGRFEVLQREPLVIVDGAHNQAAARVLVETITELFPHKKIIFVCGFSELKDIKGMCEQFSRIAKKVIVTKSRHPRARSLNEDERRAYLPGVPSVIVDDLREVMHQAQQGTDKSEVIIVTGSLYLVSEVRELCTSTKV